MSRNDGYSTNDEQQSGSFGIRKKVSVVWKYFDKRDRSKVRCRLCQHEQNYQGTTGNILRHLKNKHNIDATIKGQQNITATEVKDPMKPTEQEQIIEMDRTQENADEVTHYEVVVKTENLMDSGTGGQRPQRQAKSKKISYREDADIEDPYIEASLDLESYVAKDIAPKNEKNSDESSSKQRNHSVAEQRLLAEIEYYREKAAYYRMQKNLTALQAKKVRYELGQYE